MIRPDDEDKPFVARWNSFVRVLLVEPSVKLVARSAMDYADLFDGTSCHPSNERLARETGYNERTIRSAWSVIRGLGMAERVSYAMAHRRKADEYELVIPEGWDRMPVIGPRGRKFTCLYCDTLINPRGNNELGSDGSVRFDVRQFVFCPEPRKTKGRDAPSCAGEWNRARKAAAEPSWVELGPDVWKLFRQSRGDDW